MNGNEPSQRITRLEEAVKHLQRTVEEGFARMERGFAELKEGQRILRHSIEALRQEFHRDRRFSAMVFLTTQLAVIGALFKLAGIL